MKTHGNNELQSAFKVISVGKSFRRAVPRRISSIRPFKHIENFDANWMKKAAYAHADLSEYNDCWTGEMAMRPIPFVSTDQKPLRTQDLFNKYIGVVFDYLLPKLLPAYQTINKVSSLGYPISANPGTGLNERGIKEWQSKFDVVLDLFIPMQEGDFSLYKEGYHTIGVRKQNEPPDKLRDFQFIDSNGSIFQLEVGAKEREIEVPQLGTMIGSRTRTIVRPPVVNLWLQCWDTILHNAILAHPLFDSNVYVHTEWPSDSHFVTFDCKHYERYLGLCAISYAEAVGGRYGEQLNQLIHYPFIVPSSDWKRFFEITPQYRPGVYPQFSSGLSPVAPLGKLTNICVQVAYFVEVKHQDANTAIATVFSGISDKMRRWSYGDDNKVLGDETEVHQFTSFMSDYLEIELDPVPHYLGTVFRRDTGRWMLPKDTYNLKLYQPERDFEWKDYPNLGMVERRATFSKYGEPEIGRIIIPYEDELWNAINHPFVEVAAAAVAERIKASQKGIQLNKYLVTDKDYLMTEEERIASGLYWHLKPDVTTGIVLSLVGNNVRERLTFKHARFTPIPQSDQISTPFVQTEAQTEEPEQEMYATEANQ